MQEMQELFQGLGNGIQKFLPLSPFRQFINGMEKYDWGWLNWLLPIDRILKVTIAWCAAIAVFYAYQIVLRWLKVIE